MASTAAARLHEAVLALVFLTRLPLARLLPAGRVIALNRALWAFPLAGLVAGGLASLPLLLDAPAGVRAALALALLVWLTAGLHEDGLADFADGMGGADRSARLAIMRDSRIGAYGAQALALAFLLRWSGIAAGGPAALIASVVGARVAMVGLMAALAPARADGLGRGAGRASLPMLAAAGLIGGGLVLALTGAAAILPLACGALAAAAVGLRARRALGGQTGDVLGAGAVAAETGMLVGFALIG